MSMRYFSKVNGYANGYGYGAAPQPQQSYAAPQPQQSYAPPQPQQSYAGPATQD